MSYVRTYELYTESTTEMDHTSHIVQHLAGLLPKTI